MTVLYKKHVNQKKTKKVKNKEKDPILHHLNKKIKKIDIIKSKEKKINKDRDRKVTKGKEIKRNIRIKIENIEIVKKEEVKIGKNRGKEVEVKIKNKESRINRRKLQKRVIIKIKVEV